MGLSATRPTSAIRTLLKSPPITDPHLRAARLDEAIDAAAGATAVSAALALGLLAVFSTSPERVDVACVMGIAALASIVAFAARRPRWRATLTRAPRLGESLLTASAGLLGLAWGSVPLVLFAGADGDLRLAVVAAAGCAMANVYRWGPIQSVCAAYLLPICGGACLGLAMGDSLGTFGLALAAPCLGLSLLAHGRRLNAASTRRLADHLRLDEQHAMIHELLLDLDENESDWLWRTDAEDRLRNVAEGIGEGVAFSFEAFAEMPFASVFARRDGRLSNGARAVLAAMAARKPFRNQLVEVAGEETSRWWRLSGKPVVGAEGAFAGYRGVGSDMTGARNSESRIAYLANNDALTGFANRASFQTYAERQCAAAVADGHGRALLCLDLDGFKSINDSLGHEGGDEMLKEVAARLTAAAPVDTFIARLGGDEFALWLEATTPAKAESAAHKLIDSLTAPFDIHGATVEIGASVGIALAPKHANDADSLLGKADLALYRAKGDGKGRACTFMEEFETQQLERRKLESDLKLALARGEFELYYQPLVDVAEARVGSFEALIRWNSPDRGFVSPAEFIPAAEAMGLITPIGRWALFAACREAVRWPEDVRVAVNVSPPQVRSPDFLQDVTMALKTSGLHPTRLEIEVTEGVFLDKSPAALAALRTLRDRGIQVALDDFGTGYSSLNYLIDFPVAKIKIDRSFVTDLPTSETAQAVVEAMLGLAKRLSIKVVAEGVETKEQALALKRRRCDTIQGYLFSKPRPAADVAEMIASAPAIFRDALPAHLESPLALALAAKKQGAA